jgi:hypothetical protein
LRQKTQTGGVAERLKAHAWKVCMRETVSRVRIPPPPPQPPQRIEAEVAASAPERAAALKDNATALTGETISDAPRPLRSDS